MSRTRWATVAIALAFATLLRINDLGHESLWHDEAHSALQARAPFLTIARDCAATDNNPPVYYQLLRAWSLLFGEHEVAVRSLSVAAGIAGIAAAYALARALGGSMVALWTVLLVGSSFFHVLYSREARMYSLLSMFATLSMYAFVRLPERRRAIDVCYIVSAVGTFYAHTVGIFVVLAHQLCWAAMRPLVAGDRSIPVGRWVRLQLIVAACIAPWALVSNRQMHRLEGVFWISPPTRGTVVDVLIEMAGSTRLFWFAAALVAVGLASLFVATLQPPRVDPDAELPPILALVTLTTWSIAPIALPWVVSFIVVPILIPRVAIASLAPLAILMAFGITAIKPRVAGAIVGLLLVVASTVEVVEWERRTTKENWRDLTKYVEDAAQPGDLLLVHQTLRRQGLRYYLRRTDLPLSGFPERRFPAGEYVRPEDMAALDPVIGDRRRIWLILSDSKDPQGLIAARLAKSHTPRGRREFFGLAAELFER